MNNQVLKPIINIYNKNIGRILHVSIVSLLLIFIETSNKYH